MTRLYLSGKVMKWNGFGVRPDGKGPRGAMGCLLVFDTFEAALEAVGGDCDQVFLMDVNLVPEAREHIGKEATDGQNAAG